MAMPRSAQLVHRTTATGLSKAVHKSKPLSRDGILERLFTLAFSGTVIRRSGKIRLWIWLLSTFVRTIAL